MASSLFPITSPPPDMPIQIHDLPPDGGEPRMGPVLVCEWCGKPIESHKDGGALFDDPPSPVLFVHRGVCDRALAALQGRRCWMEIGDLMVFLSNRIGYDQEEARASVWL